MSSYLVEITGETGSHTFCDISANHLTSLSPEAGVIAVGFVFVFHIEIPVSSCTFPDTVMFRIAEGSSGIQVSLKTNKITQAANSKLVARSRL